MQGDGYWTSVNKISSSAHTLKMNHWKVTEQIHYAEYAPNIIPWDQIMMGFYFGGYGGSTHSG